MDIFNKTYINKNISISYNELNKDIDLCLLNILRNKYENKCSEFGLIRKDSIKIIKRSNFYVNDFYNSSMIKININFECEICNPKQNLIIKCKVKDNIKPGIIAYLHPLEIIVPIALHNNQEVFKNFKEDDEIEINILKSKFKLNEKLIQCIGILKDEKINVEEEDSNEKLDKNDDLSNEEFSEEELDEDDEEDYDEDDEEDDEEEDEEEDEDGEDEEEEEDEEEDKEEEETEEESDIINDEESDDEKEDIITNSDDIDSLNDK